MVLVADAGLGNWRGVACISGFWNRKRLAGKKDSGNYEQTEKRKQWKILTQTITGISRQKSR